MLIFFDLSSFLYTKLDELTLNDSGIEQQLKVLEKQIKQALVSAAQVECVSEA